MKLYNVTLTAIIHAECEQEAEQLARTYGTFMVKEVIEDPPKNSEILKEECPK